MSKPPAPRILIPAGFIVALAVVAALVLLSAGPAGLGASGNGLTAAPIAEGPHPASALNAEQRSRVRASLGALPLAFEANRGQTDPRVKYMARGEGYTLFLTANDAVFSFNSPRSNNTRSRVGRELTTQSNSISGGNPQANSVVRMKLIGGNLQARIDSSKRLNGKINYFIGNDRSKWQREVPQYARVSYRDVYPGIDMAFYGVQRQLEFDFIVAAGADPAPIRLGVSGAGPIATDAGGNLVLASSAGDVLLHKPAAYQEKDGARQPVDARFVMRAGNQVSFALGNYDRSRELVIDPSVTYSTYLGGLAEDDGFAIAVDSSGNAYITGQTKSTNFPIVPLSFSTSNAGSFDVFVTKISADGSTLIYSTYVGGSGDDSGNAIAVNASGDAFVAGATTSSTNFPTTINAFQTVFGGGSLDGFVFQLNSSGTALTYSTYLGGSGTDGANGIALDSSGNTYIVGSTGSTDFPVLNPIQATLAGASNGFVTKLNSSGKALVYSTYLGGGSGDFAAAVAVDPSNNAYVTGATLNSGFPVTAGAFQTSCGTAPNCNGGLSDAFVTVFNPTGNKFVYSTFLGGENVDEGLGIAVDALGDAYVTGLTASNGQFPLKAALQPTFGGGGQDAFVSELNPSGSALVYSTFLGGNLADAGTGIAVDESEHAYVTGQTASPNFPTASPTQIALGGGNDAFVTEISASGSLLFSTYLGGSLNENTNPLSTLSALGAIAVDHTGTNIYVTANTTSTDFPVKLPFQVNNGGGIDAFVTKYAQANFALAASTFTPGSVSPGSPATSAITVSALNGFVGTVALTCSVSPVTANSPTCGVSPTSVNPGTPSTLTVTTSATTTLGTYTITVTGTSSGFVHTATANLSVNDFTIAASALNPARVNPGGSAVSTVTVGAIGGFNGSVALTCSILPATATPPTCGYSTTPVTPPATPTLTVSSTSSTTPANYTITVTGTSGAVVHSTTVTLTVNGFLISATTPAAVNPGTSGISTVTVTALNGYSMPVSLTCSVTGTGTPLPACSAASFSANPVTPTAQTTLTITTTPPVGAMLRSRSALSGMWMPLTGISLVGLCFASAGFASTGFASDAGRRKLLALLVVGVIIAPLLILPSCSSSGGSSCAAAPSAPTGLAATSTTGTGTTLSWTAATVGSNCSVTSYTIYKNGAQIGTSSTTSFSVTGLSPSTAYTFTVAASDSAGMSPQSAPLVVTTTNGATPAGNYRVTITGTDANGLSNSTQVTLTVN